MLIGAGEMAELAATHLRAQGCTNILVANRTLERARKLAQNFDGHALTLEHIEQYLDAADIVLSSTGANTFVLLPDTVERAIRKRKNRPMFLVDIAVPRDIDPRIAELDDIYLYDIDDLQQVVQGNREQRGQEAEKARALLHEEAEAFLNWLKSLETVPLIRNIQTHMEQLRQEELAKAEKYLKGLSPEQREAMERFSRALMKRFMHPALKTLKTLPADIEGDLLMGSANRLFGLEQTRASAADAGKESDEQPLR